MAISDPPREGMQAWSIIDMTEMVAAPVTRAYLRISPAFQLDALQAGPAWGSCLTSHAGYSLHSLRCPNCIKTPERRRHLDAWEWLWTWQ